MHSVDDQIEKLRQQLSEANRKLQKAQADAKKEKKRANAADRRAKKADQLVKDADRRAAAQTRRADAAEERAKKAEEKNSLYAFCLPYLDDLLKECIELSDEIFKDLPEPAREQIRNFVRNRRNEMENLPQFKILGALAKGVAGRSEKAKRRNRPDKADPLSNTSKPKNRSNKGTKAMEAADAAEKAAKEAAAENPTDELLAAASDIANMRQPDIPEEEKQPTPGRQTVAAAADAKKEEPSKVEVCPYCGSKDLITGRLYYESLRTMANAIKQLASYAKPAHQAVRCNACGRAWEQIDGAVGVAPHRTISQEHVISVGVMNAMGIAVHKALGEFIQNEQLGHETMNSNMDDWANMYGQVMTKALNEELLKQPVVVADETPFNVLQSKFQGPCASPQEEAQRQKDYIGVKCTPFNAKRQIVLFHYLGGRSTGDLASMLEGVTSGTLVTDAYAAYNRICNEAGADKLKHQNCLVHLRREFLTALNIPVIDDLLFGSKVDNAVETVKKRFEDGKGAPFYFCIVLSALGRIYGYEREIQQGENESRASYLRRLAEHREKNSAPAMKAIDTILSKLAEDHTCLRNEKYVAKNPGSLIDKAIVYYMNQRDNFFTFLKDPEVPPDSNVAETSIRAIAVLRKATDFKQSQDSTRALCTWFSLHETAKANGISDTVRWLTDFGRALYQHKANFSLEKELAMGRNLDSKLMHFADGSEAGFDITPWLPWNYVSRLKAAGQTA